MRTPAFFLCAFELSEFEQLVVNSSDAQLNLTALQDAYLGFVVVKPLPFTVVGRTCLSVYPNDGAIERRYPVTCKERVNLFGLPLEVDTLPFQEQDRDIAACATSALWSVFYATGRRFQHAIPSPVQITKAATQRAGYDERVLPNGKGLNNRQIADAIRSVGLEPATIGLGIENKPGGALRSAQERTALLKIATAAYLAAGIPCLLLGQVRDKTPKNDGPILGSHARAVAGYRFEQIEPTAYGKTGILFSATQMTHLYAHDDQVGPFARMKLLDNALLDSAQVNDKGERYKRVVDPQTLVVPLYNKIRIPFHQIMQIAINIDMLINNLQAATTHSAHLNKKLVWDLQLMRLEDYRASLRDAPIDAAAKLRILTRSLPRFLWVLTANSSNQQKLFELLFDPTDLLQGRLFLDVVGHEETVFQFLVSALAPMDAGIWTELSLETIRIELAKYKSSDDESARA